METISALRRLDQNLQLPWSADKGSVFRQQDQSFRQLLCYLLTGFCLVGVLLPLVPVPVADQLLNKPRPLVLARIELAEPLPVPEPVIEEVAVKPEPVEEPRPVEKAKPPEKVKTVVLKPVEPEVTAVKQPQEKTPPVEKPQPSARERAMKSGVLQFADELKAMRQTVDPAMLKSARLTDGSQAAENLTREVLGQKVKTATGGIATSGLNRTVASTNLAAMATSDVVQTWDISAESASTNSGGGQRIQSRSDEDIRRIMDQNKGAIFAIYNRALRKNPLLKGKLTVEMVINEDGSIESLELLASDLGDADLEHKLVSRIKMIEFNARNVARTTLNYSFDFLPG